MVLPCPEKNQRARQAKVASHIKTESWLTQRRSRIRLAHSTHLGIAIMYIAAAACFIVMFVHAWVAEDAFITFRVVDNVVHGYGLRWNVDDRVQTYTNPLWMVLHIPFYAFCPNIALVSIGLSIACTITCLALALRTFRPAPLHAVAFLLLPFLLSKTLTDYSSSGLENPLTLFLFACFGAMLRSNGHHPPFYQLTSITALSIVNRLDTCLVYAQSFSG